MKKNDGFKVVQGPVPEHSPHLRWNGGSAYPLVEIGRDGMPASLPRDRQIFSERELMEHPDILLLSEHSGGSRDYLNWFRERLDKKKEKWIMTHTFRWSKNTFGHGDTVEDSLLDALLPVGSGNMPTGQRGDHLFEFARGVAATKEKHTLIIRDLTALPEADAVGIAGSLRSIRDQQIAPKLHVVLVEHSEDVFLDKYYRSGYIAFLRQFRTARLQAEEVRKLADNDVKPDDRLRFEEEALDEFMELTGGQPLLVQHLLRKLQEIVLSSVLAGKGDIREAARHLHSAPHPLISLWQSSLEKLLKKHPGLIPRIEAYIRGTTHGPAKFPLPPEERQLFIAGWVGLNRRGRWGITSRLHAHFAAPVLDEFQGAGE